MKNLLVSAVMMSAFVFPVAYAVEEDTSMIDTAQAQVLQGIMDSHKDADDAPKKKAKSKRRHKRQQSETPAEKEIHEETELNRR